MHPAMHPAASMVRSWALGVIAVSLGGCYHGIRLHALADRCTDEPYTYVKRWDSDGHALLAGDDYPGHLCGWDQQPLDKRERRRMQRSITHHQIADSWVRLGDSERALAALRRDLAGASTPEARVRDRVEIAEILSANGDHDAALRELDAALDDMGGVESRKVEDTRVDILVEAGRHWDAIALLEARPASERVSTEVTKQLRLGRLLLDVHETDRAEQAYTKALELCEWGHGLYDAWYSQLGLARVLQQRGRTREAIEALDQMLAGEPYQGYLGHDHSDLWLLRADLWLELDEPWNAAASLRRAFEFEHRFREPTELERASLRDRLAALHGKAGRYDLALSGYEAAYRGYMLSVGELDSRTAVAAHNVGHAYMEMDDHEQARVWLEWSLELHDRAGSGDYDRGITLLNLGNVEMHTDRPVDAARSYTAAITLLESIDDPHATVVTPQVRARLYREAARAYLDIDACAEAITSVGRAQEWAATSEPIELPALLGTHNRAAKLRRCRLAQG